MAIHSAKQLIDWAKIKDLWNTERWIVDFEKVTATSGALALDKPVSLLDTTAGVSTSTLANGHEGQIKVVNMIVDNGDNVLTPSSFRDSTITFDDAQDYWIGIFAGGQWETLNATATVA